MVVSRKLKHNNTSAFYWFYWTNEKSKKSAIFFFLQPLVNHLQIQPKCESYKWQQWRLTTSWRCFGGSSSQQVPQSSLFPHFLNLKLALAVLHLFYISGQIWAMPIGHVFNKFHCNIDYRSICIVTVLVLDFKQLTYAGYHFTSSDKKCQVLYLINGPVWPTLPQPMNFHITSGDL